jgi:hypothetical protein
VVNAAGAEVRATYTAPAADGGRFELVIPYTFVKGQAAWMNGVELGRYAITLGGNTRRFLITSTDDRVAAALERELAGGLRTWEAVFKSVGYVPTGLGAGGDWDRFSDSGGYAHLIQAAAQYVTWKAGRRDWEEQVR